MSDETLLWPIPFGRQFDRSDFLDLMASDESWLRRASVDSRTPIVVITRSESIPERCPRPTGYHIAINRSGSEVEQLGASGSRHLHLQGQALHLFLDSGQHVTYWGRFRVDSECEQLAILVRPTRVELSPPDDVTWESMVPYEDLENGIIDPTTFTVSTSKRDEGADEHRRTQNLVAQWLRRNSEVPLRLSTNELRSDVAWKSVAGDFVCEVKSISADNERGQVREGVGQVIEYSGCLNAVPILMLSRQPAATNQLRGALARGVYILWPDVLAAIAPDDLLGSSPSQLFSRFASC